MATVIVLAASVSGQHPAKAYEAPWCAVISDGYWDCQYRSIEECRPNVLAGNRGWCNPSPYYVARPGAKVGASANVVLALSRGPSKQRPRFRCVCFWPIADLTEPPSLVARADEVIE